MSFSPSSAARPLHTSRELSRGAPKASSDHELSKQDDDAELALHPILLLLHAPGKRKGQLISLAFRCDRVAQPPISRH